MAAHPYSQLSGDVSRTSPCVLWVKVGVGAAEEAWFEDISTATVWKEAALVKVHLLPRRLKVQGHYKAHGGMQGKTTKTIMNLIIQHFSRVILKVGAGDHP